MSSTEKQGIQNLKLIPQEAPPEVLKALKTCSLFEGLSETTLDKIAPFCQITPVGNGQQLINDKPTKEENPLITDRGLIMVLGNAYGVGIGMEPDFSEEFTAEPGAVLGERGFLGAMRAGTILVKGSGKVLVLNANLEDLQLTPEEQNIIVQNAIKNTHLGTVNQQLEGINREHRLWPIIADTCEELVGTIDDNLPTNEIFMSQEFEPGTEIEPIQGHIFVVEKGEVRVTITDEETERQVDLSNVKTDIDPETKQPRRNIIHEVVGAGGEATAKTIARTPVKGRYISVNSDLRTASQQRNILEAMRTSLDMKLALSTEKIFRRMEQEAKAEAKASRAIPQTLADILGRLLPAILRKRIGTTAQSAVSTE